MTRTKARACDGKVRYGTRRAAEGALTALIRGRGASPAAVNTYRCRHCAGYHIGHRPRGRRR